MGRNGEAMRQAKAQKTFTFTREQLEARDRTLIQSKKQQLMDEVNEFYKAEFEKKRKEVDDYIAAEWEQRELLFGGTHQENMFLVLQFLLAVSSRILIEHFGWTPIPRDGRLTRRNRTAKFADLLVEEINAITGDETRDIRDYCNEVYDLYGVRFVLEDTDE